MAQSVLLANSGRQGAAGEGSTMGNLRKIGSTEVENRYGLPTTQSRDNFKCTYFRHRIPKTGKRNIFSWSDDVPVLSDHVPTLSDSYSESDSESDNTIHVVRWLESLPVDQQFYTIEEDVPGSEGMNIDNSINTDKIDDPWDSNTIIRSVSSGIAMAVNSNEENEDISATRTYVKPVSVRKITKRRDNIKRVNEAVLGDNIAMDFNDSDDENRMLEFREDDKDKSVERKGIIKDSVKSMEEHEELKQMREMMDQLLSVRRDSAELPTCDYEKCERQRKSSGRKETRESLGLRKQSGHRSRKLLMTDNQETIDRSERGTRGKTSKVKSKKNLKTINKSILNREKKEDSVQKVRFAFTNRSKISKTLPSRNTVDKIETKTNSENNSNRRRSMKYKLERNKCLLKNVEDIMDAMVSIEESVNEENSKIHPVPVKNVAGTMTGSNTSLERRNANQRTRNFSVADDKKIDYKKPIFKNAELERMLDRDMEDALKKYKRVHETWKDLAMKNSIANSNASYEPPMKRKKKPRSSCSALSETAVRNFPTFDSWQSIHKYFLSQPQC